MLMSLSKEIRKIIFEIQNQEEETFLDSDGLYSFLESNALIGIEEDMISILERDFNTSVTSILESAITFKQIDKKIEDLTTEEALGLYLEMQNIDLNYVTEILSFLKRI